MIGWDKNTGGDMDMTTFEHLPYWDHLTAEERMLVEQNVHLAFGLADYCYALQVGQIIASGDVETIRKSGEVRKAYFGEDKEQAKS